MGCFSFLCKECGKGIKSSSFDGEECRLYWLKDGKVHQEMRGQYNSYGTVLINGSTESPSGCPDSLHWSNQKHPISGRDMMEHQTDNRDEYSGNANRGTGEWEDAWPRPMGKMDWNDSDAIKTTGIAAVHEKCFKQIPTTVSLHDPNQGWGEDDELLGATSSDGSY